MTSRSRERRRREGRTPGIWRGPLTPAESQERPAIQHSAPRRVFVSWRVFSALIVVSLSVVLYLFFASDAFYVHSVSVGGLHYLTKEEVFTYSGIANMHIFWVDPEQVRRDILREPTIADAKVYVGWPPNMVQIIIEEREPALVWVQSGIGVWIDLRGRKMRLREDRPDLLRVIDDTAEGALADNVAIPVDVVNGALQLAELLPEVDSLRYNPEKGLGYLNPGGWLVWYGVGADMPEKYLIYQAVERDMQARGKVPFEISVANPDAPYYCEENTPCAQGAP